MPSHKQYEALCHPLLLVVAGGLNLPPLVFGALGFATWCAAFSAWLVGNACITGLNMLAALYSVYIIRRTAHPEIDENEEAEQQPEESERSADDVDVEKDEQDTDSNNAWSEDEDSSNNNADTTAADPKKGCFSRLIRLKTISSDRIRHLICYNGVGTTYSIMFLFWIFWLSDGTQQLRGFDGLPEEELEGCEPFHERYVFISLVCGFSYFASVIVAVFASLCTG